jgi:hypothetical protein
MQLTRSANFSYVLDDGTAVTTHWFATCDRHGTPCDLPVEEILDLPTSYPVDSELDGLGSYRQFKLAQDGGRQSARRYAQRQRRNLCADREGLRRQRLLERIALLAAAEH